MFYVKNVPGWERVLRVIAGLAMIACGLLALKGLLIGYLLAGSGVLTMLTGFFGFCPMCAMAGRRLKD
jgi:hypothetical protein